MDIQQILSQMKGHAQAIRSLVAGCSAEQARWKPDAASWSMLEVLNHLLDEERADFRARIAMVLRAGAWFRINPGGWVTERAYNDQELGPSLESFLAARAESLEWLAGLGEVDWSTAFQAPFGTIRAGDFLASWAAHDVLHLRQLVELHWAYLVRAAEPYAVEYAGEW